MRLLLVAAGVVVALAFLVPDLAHADRPSFLDQSLDKTIVYGPHGTSYTVREAPGTGTSYVYPGDRDPQDDRYGCDHDDECHSSDDNESDEDTE
jgi:hypothetical protein